MRSKIFLALILVPVFLFPQEYQIGNSSITFIDPERNNRNIPTEIFYPADIAGTDVSPADGIFPLIVYGHGFAMNYNSYEFLWEALVPQGYILAFPKTESSIIPFPSHGDFGLDMAFLVGEVRELGLDEPSPFYGKISANTAVMGHSMGGGAAFLAAANNPGISTIVAYAPAETNPSAIAAAADVSASVIIFSGENDCVTPPDEHQIPMYNNLPDGQKMLISINGGGHCFFADYNFNCSFGENSCSPSPTITRDEQHQIMLEFLIPYLDFRLKGKFVSWLTFSGEVSTNPGASVENGWTSEPVHQEVLLEKGWNGLSFSSVPVDVTFVNLFDEVSGEIILFADDTLRFDGQQIPENYFVDPDRSYFFKAANQLVFEYAGFKQAGRSFQLKEGWNLMPVLSDELVSIDELFGSSQNDLVFIREFSGLSVLWPEKSILNLEYPEPGKIYQVKMDDPVEVTFP